MVTELYLRLLQKLMLRPQSFKYSCYYIKHVRFFIALLFAMPTAGIIESTINFQRKQLIRLDMDKLIVIQASHWLFCLIWSLIGYKLLNRNGIDRKFEA